MNRRNRHVERLLALCADEEGVARAVHALREVGDEIAIANDGQALTIEVVMLGHCHVRFGITPTGRVVYPLGAKDPADVLIEGEPEDVASWLLGERTLMDAQILGLVAVGAGVRTEPLERLRRVIAYQLRLLVEGQAVLLPVAAMAVVRARRLLQSPIEIVSVAAARAAPAIVAALSVLGGVAPSPAAQPAAAGVVAPPAPVAITGSVSAGRAAESAPPPAAKPATMRRPGVQSPPTGDGEGTAPGVRADVAQTDTGFVAGARGQDGNGEVVPWSATLRCDGSPSQAAVCGALRRAPTN